MVFCLFNYKQTLKFGDWRNAGMLQQLITLLTNVNEVVLPQKRKIRET